MSKIKKYTLRLSVKRGESPSIEKEIFSPPQFIFWLSFNVVILTPSFEA
jgi:hypothetical protein